MQNAGLKGVQGVLDRYAQQIQQSIERDGFYVRVPAGKQFYLYITQTVDRADARIGGTALGQAEAAPPSAPVEKISAPSRTALQPPQSFPTLRINTPQQKSNP